MKLLRMMIISTMLVLPALACNIAMPSNPQPPMPTFVPSANDASAFEQNFTNAVGQASQTGAFNITLNQQQFSSWLALRAPEYAKQQGYDWPLKQVQAGLDNGKITLFGVLSNILQNLNTTIKNVLTTQLAQIQGRYKLNGLTIAGGNMTVSGQIIH